jgi:hypothetical protein
MKTDSFFKPAGKGIKSTGKYAILRFFREKIQYQSLTRVKGKYFE